MKICEAIHRADSLIPNSYDWVRKIEWLSEVEGLIHRRIICHYSNMPMPSYNEDTEADTVLVVPAPHDGLYVLWLEAKIAYYNGESERYENAKIMFETAMKVFGEDCIRSCRPKSGGTWKF